jgi:two-component system cell cycle response regulator
LRSIARHGAPRAVSLPPVAQTRGTILVVDDSEVNLELVRSTLEPKGYKLIGVHTLADAVQVNGRLAFDLILSDLHMPDGDGYELIRVMKSDPRSKDIPVVIISSTSSGMIDPRTVSALGATGLIVRPIDPGDLVAQVEGCMNPGPRNSRVENQVAQDPDR